MRLCRWNLNGSTAGVWLLADVPGVFVTRHREGWTIELTAPAVGARTPWSVRAWGRDWDTADETIDAANSIPQFFPTRAALLKAFEVALCPRQDCALCDLIS